MRWLFLCLIFLSGAVELFAAGKNALTFLLIPPGARASSMGESFVGVADGPETLSVNPAGLADEVDRQVSLQHVFFVGGILMDQVSFVHPVQKGAWGVQAGFMGVGGLKRTVADPTVPDGFRETGDFSTQDMEVAIAAGMRMTESVHGGGTARFVRESLSDAAANGAGLDLGIVYQQSGAPVKFGASIQNLGPQIKFKDESFNLPALVRAGISLRLPKNSSLRWVPVKSIVSVETLKLFQGGDNSISGGIEVPFMDERLFFRMGYRYFIKKQTLGSEISLPSGFAFGLGFQVNAWNLDYALNSMGELGLTHRISLSLKFAS